MSNYPPGVTGSEPQIVGEPDEAVANHQARDGTVHLAYFDVESDTSFVWNGTNGRLVDVCPGGYGEPTRARFELQFNPFDHSLRTALGYFKTSCDSFLLRQRNLSHDVDI